MACVYGWLGRHGAERDRLAADLSLIPAALEELMRYESPVPAGIRYAEEDIDWATVWSFAQAKRSTRCGHRPTSTRRRSTIR